MGAPTIQLLLSVPLQALSLLLIARILIPPFAWLFGWWGYQNRLVAGPEDIERLAKNWVPRNLHHQLIGLGFVPLGTYADKLTFRREERDFVFSSVKDSCVAVVSEETG